MMSGDWALERERPPSSRTRQSQLSGGRGVCKHWPDLPCADPVPNAWPQLNEPSLPDVLLLRSCPLQGFPSEEVEEATAVAALDLRLSAVVEATTHHHAFQLVDPIEEV